MPHAAATVAHRLRIVDPILARETDRELLDRYLAHADQAAFAELVHRHERAIMGVCRQVLFDRADVEDAFQATFVALVERAKRIKWNDALGGWLVTVAHRVAVRTARTRSRLVRREQNAAAQPSQPTPEVGADLSWREAIAVLHEELDALPDRFRLPLIHCYLEGLSREEAASRLGWKPGKVKAGLERGREKLRVILERRGVTLSAGLLAGVVAGTSAVSASPELRAATLKAVTGQTTTAIIELARSAMPVISAKAKIAYGSVIAATLCIGLLAAIAGSPTRVAAPATPVPPATKVAPAQPQEITGRVLDPDGMPLAGVKIYAVKTKNGSEERVVIATSAADGTFKATRLNTEEGFAPLLVAQREGFGVAWHTFGIINDDNPAKSTVDLQFVPDQAITGRVIDTEGKSLAGVRVFASRVYAPRAGNLDRILDLWKLHTAGSVPSNLVRTNFGGGVNATQTDADGKFKLTGCGAERIVELTIRGENLAERSVKVVNRAKFNPSEINAAAKVWQAESPSRPLIVVYGPDVPFIAERAKTIEGVVVDAKTKKPIPGAVVSDFRNLQKADAEGRFRIASFRKAPRYNIYAAGPSDSDYLARTFRIDDTEGYSIVKCQIELSRGVVLTGTITDKVTGKPVKANVSVQPLAGNKHFAQYYPSNQPYDRNGTATDAEGRFRVVTIPGKVIVTVQVYGGIRVGEVELQPYRGAGPDPTYPEVFDTTRQPGFTFVSLADGSILPLSPLECGVRVLDIQANGKAEVNFALDPGVKGSIQIQGPDGKPMPGTTVIGLSDGNTPTKVADASATVYALDPKAKPRQILAWDAKRELGGMALIRGDEREPVTVKLAPVSDIKGKCVTSDGKPVSDAAVLMHSPDTLGAVDAFIQTEFGIGRRSAVKTAADGTFTVKGVLPGVEYRLMFWKGRTVFPRDPQTKTPSAKPESGKTVDLGTIDIGTVEEK